MFGRYTRIEGKDVARMAKRGVTSSDLIKFTAEKYDAKAAVKQAVEQLYFTDVDQQELKHFVRGISDNSQTQGASKGIEQITQRLSAD